MNNELVMAGLGVLNIALGCLVLVLMRKRR